MEKAQGHTVLVVDDEGSVTRMLGVLLARDGHRVLTASNGEEALGILRKEPVEILLSDNMMPGMAGTELLGRVETSWPHVIRILMTAEPDTDSLALAINQGHVFRYIQKPFTPQAVRETISAAVQQCELLTENRRLQNVTEEQNKMLWELTYDLELKVQQRTAEIESQKRMMEESHARLIELTGQRADMLLILAHELNTPLAVLRGFLGLLSEHKEWPAEKREQIFSLMRESVERLDRNVGGILQALDVDNEDFTLRREEFDLREAIRDASRNAQPLIESRGHHFTLELGEKAVPVSGERDLIRNALDNLLLNAIRFTPDGGKISIRLSPGNGVARILVSDTGVGIEKEKHEKIFERFYEGQDAMHHSSGSVEFGSGSLGMGLAVTKSIAERHGGAVLVESEPGKGSTFTLEIPVAKA